MNVDVDYELLKEYIEATTELVEVFKDGEMLDMLSIRPALKEKVIQALKRKQETAAALSVSMMTSMSN